MSYEKQTWVDNDSVLSAERLNYIEQGIYDANKMQGIPGITVDAGVAHGDFIYHGLIDGAEVWKKDTGSTRGHHLCGPVTDGVADAVRAGVMAMPSALGATLSASDITGRYSIYVQSDGTLNLGVTPVHAGRIRSATEMIVDFSPINTKPKVYTDNMLWFLAMTGPSGIVRLKIKMPDTATGVEIWRSTSAYADEGYGNWGTKVADITDDSNYDGPFEWYEDSGLTNGTTYYYKAFPYSGTIKNETAGVNELYCRAGKLYYEGIPGNIYGAYVVDSAGTNNGVAVNISKITGGGHLADAFSASAGYIDLSAEIAPSNKTFAIWLKPNAVSNGLWGYTSTRRYFGYMTSDNVMVAGYDYQQTALGAGSNPWVFMGCYYGNYSSGLPIKLHRNAAYAAVNTVLGSASNDPRINRFLYSLDFINSVGHAYTCNTLVDVIRVFNGEVPENEWAMLYNGGAGC